MKLFGDRRGTIHKRPSNGYIENSPDAPLGFPPGHFYSPIPSIPAVLYREGRVFQVPPELPGLDVNLDGQTATIRAIEPYCMRCPFGEGAKTRYITPNQNFSVGEAVIYFGLLNWLKPAVIVEVGSGYTTTVVLDSLDAAQNTGTIVCCIEPFPDLVRSLLRPGDKDQLRILQQELQDVNPGVFGELRAGDVLFVDSTHISKIGSDVHTLLFDVLPGLASGVYIHVHDIYYPFEYPREWLLQGRAWNEAYIVRAFLQYNNAFEIVCFNSYLAQFHPQLCASIPFFLQTPGSGLWLRKR